MTTIDRHQFFAMKRDFRDFISDEENEVPKEFRDAFENMSAIGKVETIEFICDYFCNEFEEGR